MRDKLTRVRLSSRCMVSALSDGRSSHPTRVTSSGNFSWYLALISASGIRYRPAILPSQLPIASSKNGRGETGSGSISVQLSRMFQVGQCDHFRPIQDCVLGGIIEQPSDFAGQSTTVGMNEFKNGTLCKS